MIVLDEIQELASKLHNAWWDRYKKVATEARIWNLEQQGANFLLDADGNGTFPIWQNKTGREARLSRLVLQADGFTPQTVWSSGYLYVFKGTAFSNVAVLDFLPNAPGEQIFPNIADYSEWDQPILGQNETLSVNVVGGPASVNCSMFIYGRLMPDVAELKGWS